MQPWLVFRRNRKISDHCSERTDRSFKWFSESSLMRCFPICQEILNISQIAIGFRRNCPLFSANCFFGHPICLGSMRCKKYDDSMLDLHKVCQSPTNCQCKCLFAFQTARETFVNSFPSLEKFLFYTGTTVSIEWLNLIPRLTIDVCIEIHIFR